MLLPLISTLQAPIQHSPDDFSGMSAVALPPAPCSPDIAQAQLPAREELHWGWAASSCAHTEAGAGGMGGEEWEETAAQT